MRRAIKNKKSVKRGCSARVKTIAPPKTTCERETMFGDTPKAPRSTVIGLSAKRRTRRPVPKKRRSIEE
jgi:hypothetical protein